ncbi:MAG TPA: hypothetical protein VE974_28370 [Thermoanaerobaculia bacterium]|nr:hypothetical protein [Thermoanaerobaculia bacterium]
MAETTLTTSAVLEWIRTAELPVTDRVAIVRTLRDTTPDLVAVDPRLTGRIRAAQGIDPKFIDSTVTALENSAVWQEFTSTTPKELRQYRSIGDDNRPLTEEVLAYGDILRYTQRYYHFLAVDKSREAYKAGKQMSGEARLSIQPHLSTIADARPVVGRRRRKAAETAAPPPAEKP